MSRIRLSLLTIIFLFSIFCTASVTCFAEEMTAETEAVSALNEAELTEPVTTLPVSQSPYPVLTVNAISNYFGKAYAEYNEFTREVTVTYMLKASKKLLSTCWTLIYDSTVLSVDMEKNTPETVCPLMKDNAQISFDNDVVMFSASDLRLFDYTVNEAPFVTIVFDVAELTAEDSEITKVDLTVEELWVSEPDPVSGLAMPGKEIMLVSNSKGLESENAAKVLTAKVTMLTPPTYVEPDKNATPDNAVTTASATQPTTAVQPTTSFAPKPTEPAQESDALINTGGWQIPLMILGALFACTIVLFVLRKRDIYNSY